MQQPTNATKAPRFSIITVCRNAQALIGPTIDSLARQDFRDFEYLVIDGASTDGTLDVIRTQAVGLELRMLSEPDDGIYDAMNKGARLANGQWLYFMNAGDAFVNASVLRNVAMKLKERSESDLGYGDVIYTGTGGQRLVSFKWITSRNLLFTHLCHQSVFAKRATFNRFGFFDTRYRINADFEWLLRIFRGGGRCLYLGFTIAFFDDSGVSSRAYKERRSERSTIINSYLPPGLGRPIQIAYRVSRKILRMAGVVRRQLPSS